MKIQNVKKTGGRGMIVDAGDSALYRSYASAGLSPQKLAMVLREFDDGYCANAVNLFGEMEEKDLHLAAVMQTRIMAAAAKPRRIQPGADNDRARSHADFIREVWEELEGKTRLLHDLLSAIGHGFAVAEIFYQVREGRLIAQSVKACPQQLFVFADTEKPGRLLEFPRYLKPDGTRPIDLPREKFVYHLHYAASGSPVRSGLYRGLAWYFLFSNFTMKDWMSFMDLYGIPLRLGRFKPTADERARDVLKRAVQNLGSDAAAVISDDTTIEFIESSLSGSHDLFRNAVEFFNRQKSKRVLGQTLTTEQGTSGSYALGGVHERVRHDLTRLDCRLLDETLTRDLVVPLIKANFGPQGQYPRFVTDTQSQTERSAELETMKKLFDMGAPLPLAKIYAAAGIEEPVEGERMLIPPKTGGLQ